MTKKINKEDKPVEPRLQISKGIRTLECKLTPEELRECSKLLAEAIRKKGEIEGELDKYKALKKSEISSVEADISINSQKINSEKDYRAIECEIRLDYHTSRRTITRKDTGEIIEDRPLDTIEKQMELSIGEGVASGK